MISFLLLILAIIGTLCIGGNWVSSLDWLSHLQFWIALSMIPGVVVSLINKKRFFGIWLLILAGYHLWIVFPYLPKPVKAIEHKPEDVLTVVQYNMNADNTEYPAIVQAIEKADPDLLVICEANNHILGRLTHLEEKYPWRIQAGRWPYSSLPASSGTILWSKFPFASEETLTLDKGYIQLLHTVVEIRDTPINIFALHLPSPVNSLQSRRRNDGIREIADLVQGHENALVIGDFNNTLWSATIRRFLKDTGLRSVYRFEGVKASWPSPLGPFGIAIDQIFYSDILQPVDVDSVGAFGSDHRMLKAQFILNPQQ